MEDIQLRLEGDANGNVSAMDVREQTLRESFSNQTVSAVDKQRPMDVTPSSSTSQTFTGQQSSAQTFTGIQGEAQSFTGLQRSVQTFEGLQRSAPNLTGLQAEPSSAQSFTGSQGEGQSFTGLQGEGFSCEYVRNLLTSSVQAAVAMVRDAEEGTTRATRRITLLLKLLDGEEKFAGILACVRVNLDNACRESIKFISRELELTSNWQVFQA